MEAALLSNTLHEYRDDDIDGRRSVVNQIMEKRHEWTRAVRDIEYFKETGKLPDAQPTQDIFTALPGSPELAQLRVELARLNSNISKYSKKVTDNPEHKKIEKWKEDLAKMEALKLELKQSIVNLHYASK
ncbi:hypothetical protein [Dyadobacter sp. CY343]|uniref:hypothetical protein n=1 Tax=Dyadobacter sp. CY343 TaxID=2907299 RepID=UPI001F3FEA2D|nr:hypothetical protein [Dyadobacter sp. CY343]MCE7061266.1 hypothetical protein [Dyadobacter sp. CY343]